MKNRLPLSLFLTLSPFFFMAAEPVRANDGLIPIVNEWFSKIHPQLYRIRLSSSDFQIPSGAPLPHSLSSVERLFNDPWEAPRQSTEWADSLEDAPGPYHLVRLAATAAGEQDLQPSPPQSIGLTGAEKRKFEVDPFFGPLRGPLLNFLNQASAAREKLAEANKNLNEKDPREVLSLIEMPEPESGIIQESFSSRRTKARFALMDKWDQAGFYQSALTLTDAVETLVNALRPLAGTALPSRKQVNTPLGKVLFAGSGDDEFSADDLAGALLIVDLGGTNRYGAGPARAERDEVRVVIDFGRETTIAPEDQAQPGTGAGFFGMGIFIRPVPDGKTSVSGGSYAQGFGAGGLGLFFSEGACDVSGGRYVQGAAFFGVGIFSCSGSGSKYWAERNGQGHGATGGIGLFRHSGNDTQIQGGLVQPDPREPQGAVSLCQGVGTGRRAYAGGGVGAAVVKGDRVTVEGSYFAQGAGYWHGLGIFRFKGNGSRLQARRYDFGTGVHFAFGHFQSIGDRNRILNWGVGPAHAWDNSFGSALILGSDNEIQTNWGSSTAQIGGYSALFLKGNRNLLQLPDFGKGNHLRGLHSFTAHWMEGEENKLQHPASNKNLKDEVFIARSPWGFFRSSPLALVKDLGLKEPEWPELKRETPVEREAVDLQTQIKMAAGKDRISKLADLVDVAAAFSLDKTSPRRALEELLSLPPEDVPALVDILDPAAYEQRIQLGIILPAYGNMAGKAILNSLNNPKEGKKSLLLSQLAFHRPSLVLPGLMEMSATDELTAAAVIGRIFNRDNGDEPGRRSSLETLHAVLSENREPTEVEINLLGRLRPWAAFALLSAPGDSTKEDRLALLKEIDEDITAPINPPAAKKLIELNRNKGFPALARLKEDLDFLDESEPRARALMRDLIASTNTAVIRAGLAGLGKLGPGEEEDITAVVNLIHHSDGMVREEAAVALGRMGEKAAMALNKIYRTESPPARRVIIASLPHAVSGEFSGLFKKGLADEDPLVRWMALGAVQDLSPAMEPFRKKIMRWAEKAGKKGGVDEAATLLFTK